MLRRLQTSTEVTSAASLRQAQDTSSKDTEQGRSAASTLSKRTLRLHSVFVPSRVEGLPTSLRSLNDTEMDFFNSLQIGRLLFNSDLA